MRSAHKVTIIAALIAALASIIAAWISTSPTETSTRPTSSGVNVTGSRVEGDVVGRDKINIGVEPPNHESSND
jgi:hypothetical protein